MSSLDCNSECVSRYARQIFCLTFIKTRVKRSLSPIIHLPLSGMYLFPSSQDGLMGGVTQCVLWSSWSARSPADDDAWIQPPQSQTGGPTTAPCPDAILELFMLQRQKSTACPHYLWIPYSRILFIKICQPQINTPNTFLVICVDTCRAAK